ncbi:hypothetical protein BJ170DRAFT_65951 [Xylariales sp. AK1849]|nr:hypothetical protein BJ170DRAFT_65951 [Xylariales sp. AK1849]
MDLSPPSLTRSPVSSPNTDYPSPDLIDSHYRIASMYDQTCGMNPDLESETLPSLDTTTTAGWGETTLLHPSTCSGIPNILSAEYDPFANYDPSLPPSYTHDLYSISPAQAPIISLSPQPLSRTLSYSPDPSFRQSFAYRHSGSPTPRIKMEGASEYPNPDDVSQYPSPHGSHALPAEIGGYSSAASSSGYLSDVASGSWPKSEYPPLEPEPFPSGPTESTPSLLRERQPYRIQRAPRTRSRRLTTKDEANYQCDVMGCGKLFSRSYNYKAHLETHDEKREYPFPCTSPDCNKKFVRKTDLQRHQQSVHLKERNHKCDYCARMFARKDTLRRHMEDGCSKRFDIGTLDLREANESSFNTRSAGNLLSPNAQLPPLTHPRPHSPNPDLLEPVGSLMRRGY